MMAGESGYYRPPINPVPDDGLLGAINALRTEYEDTGWLSTLIWNVRNNYMAWPYSTFPASQVRMIVEGFLAEIAALKAGSDEY